MSSVEKGEVFDYVIVGGGTAGCVLAARLTEDPGVRVLLLEAGPKPDSLWIKMPAGMGRLFVNPTYNWGFETEPEPHIGERRLYWPQGKTLGGSSAINGMAFVRGHAEDYDGWRDGGAAGWGWEDVLPYFRRLESRTGNNWRGCSGPLKITDPVYIHPTARAFCDAAVATGLPHNPDYNGASQEGASFLQYTIKHGLRHSAADAYLRSARKTGRLKIETDAFAQKVLFERGKATGVVYRADGEIKTALASGEVIVTSGAVGSPRLLLLSGIGRGETLSRLGIDVVANLPGVGENLVDHPYVHMTFRVRTGASLNARLGGWRVYAEGARWLLTRGGPLTSGASQAVAFVRGAPDAARPDLQINFRPMSHSYDAAGRLGPDKESRVTAAICALRPQSRGRLWLHSPDPDRPPAILGNYLSARHDEDVLAIGVQKAREIFNSEPLKSLVISEDKPGAAAADATGIRAFIRETVQTMAHPVGACRIGRDQMGVVDERLLVREVKGLRVVDSSVMPTIVSGNTVAATYMIAEKGADLIKADRRG